MTHSTSRFDYLLGVALICLVGAGSAAAQTAAQPDGFDALIAKLEGGWAGGENMTPLGPIPFAMLFDRAPDGSLYSRTALNRDTYFEMRFTRDESGAWRFYEEGALEGTGVQAHSLVPAGLTGDTMRWVHADNPEFLTVDMTVGSALLTMTVRLKGQDHVRFELSRLPAAAIPALRRQLAQAEAQEPGGAAPIVETLGGNSPTSQVAAARLAVLRRPEDPGLRLELARALNAAIQENPMANGLRLAPELLASLEKALELAPHLSEPYRRLAEYYMTAPPIVGGSLDKAEDVVRRLAGIDAESAGRIMSDIAARRGQE